MHAIGICSRDISHYSTISLNRPPRTHRSITVWHSGQLISDCTVRNGFVVITIVNCNIKTVSYTNTLKVQYNQHISYCFKTYECESKTACSTSIISKKRWTNKISKTSEIVTKCYNFVGMFYMVYDII